VFKLATFGGADLVVEELEPHAPISAVQATAASAMLAARPSETTRAIGVVHRGGAKTPSPLLFAEATVAEGTAGGEDSQRQVEAYPRVEPWPGKRPVSWQRLDVHWSPAGVERHSTLV
jgi:hypothetical protein